jgi:hypothetical protein
VYLTFKLRAPTGNAGRGSSERSFSYEKRLILPNHDAAFKKKRKDLMVVVQHAACPSD